MVPKILNFFELKCRNVFQRTVGSCSLFCGSGLQLILQNPLSLTSPHRPFENPLILNRPVLFFVSFRSIKWLGLRNSSLTQHNRSKGVFVYAAFALSFSSSLKILSDLLDFLTNFRFENERVHLHSHRSGRYPGWKCLLGTLLPRAWHPGIFLISLFSRFW